MPESQAPIRAVPIQAVPIQAQSEFFENCLLEVQDGRIAVNVARRDPSLIHVLREGIDERTEYNFQSRAWMFPMEGPVIRRLCAALMIEPANLPPQLFQILAGTVDPFEREPPGPEVLERARRGWRSRNTPFPHQLTGIAWLLQEPKFLLAWDMGTGKTAIGVTRAVMAIESGELDEPNSRGKVLVVCPKPALDVWEDEFRTHAGYKPFVFDSDSSQKISRADKARRIIIANYDILWRRESILKEMGIRAILADEIQRLKDTSTKVSKAAMRLAMRAKCRWGLSGTPFPNGPLDVHGVMTFIDPAALGCSQKTIFKRKYCLMGAKNPAKVVAIQNAEDLQRRVASRCSTLRKEQVLTSLPPKVYQKVRCGLTDEQNRIYQEIRKDSLARLRTMAQDRTLTVANVLTESMRLLQVVGGFLPDDEGDIHEIGSAKIPVLMDLIEGLGTQPAIIWCAFKNEIGLIQRNLIQNFGQAAAGVAHSGELSREERQQVIGKFKSGEARYLISTSPSLREAVTLIKSGNRPVANVIYYSRSYNLLDWMQSQDRAHRIGQEEQVTIYKMVSAATIDVKVDNALDAKEKLQDKMLEGGLESLL